MGNKVWLSMHPRKFGNHVTVRPSVHPPSVRTTSQGNQCEMSFSSKCGSLQPAFHLNLVFHAKLDW